MPRQNHYIYYPDFLQPRNVRRLRRVLGYTQARLARTLHVQPATVSRWESGRRRPLPCYRIALQLLWANHRLYCWVLYHEQNIA